MHPACLRLLLCFFLVASDTFFLVVIVKVGEETGTKHYLCKENNATRNGSSKNGICWTWNLSEADGNCMFTLLFAATLCLHLAIFVFLVSSILKCLFPECAIMAQRSLLIKYIGRYLSVVLSSTACVLASSLLVYVSVNDSKGEESPCFKTGHLWRNCRKGDSGCYVYIILLTGCICSLIATLLSACDARMMYITNKELDEQEQIYREYVDYQAFSNLDSY